MSDSILIELYKHRFGSIAEEMGKRLERSAFSSNIKERKDFSCALFDAQGEMIAQAEHLPVHLGSMPMSVAAAIAAHPFEPGDSVLLNDPYQGGTHLPDITMIDPVFVGDTLLFYVASRAHHADVGGMQPGSMPLSTDIFQEGLRIPPIKWRQQGHIQQGVLDLVLANVRTPNERHGDLMAQSAANQLAIARLKQLLETHGHPEVLKYAEALKDYAHTMMASAIGHIPDGEYFFEDHLDNDGISPEPIPLKVRIQIKGQEALVDFSGSAPQTQGCVNTIRAVTVSSVFYAFRCLLDPNVPSNAGCLRPIDILMPEGSVLDARFPSAVVGGNVETSQRVVDLIFGALAQALPDQIPAASCGSMNNICVGGQYNGRPFTYYETMGGGSGASAAGPGASGIHTHMTNTLNTPIEALEMTYPFRVNAYHLLPQTGGEGAHRGGDGLVREITFLEPVDISLLTERREKAPYGLQGGQPGTPGKNRWISEGETQELPAKIQCKLNTGDTLRIETPGGGGWHE